MTIYPANKYPEGKGREMRKTNSNPNKRVTSAVLSPLVDLSSDLCHDGMMPLAYHCLKVHSFQQPFLQLSFLSILLLLFSKVY